MKHGSLFSGIGGFDLAAEWMGWQNIFQVEKDAYCTELLKLRFPNTKQYGDIRNLKVDGDGNLVYCDCDEKREIQNGKRNVRKGAVDSGDSQFIRSDTSSDVESSQAQRCCVPTQLEIPTREPFLQRNEGERLCTEHDGVCNPQGDIDKEDSLRDVQRVGNIQEWKNQNSGTPPRLQSAIRGNVAVPKMPSSMAQKQQTKTLNVNTINPVSGSCQRQHPIVARRGEIDILSGGFP
jgi:hypothetical protein